MAGISETEQQNLRAVSDVLTYWNRHDVAGVLDYYDDDIIWTNVALEEQYHGKAAVRTFIEQLIVAFPNLNFSVSERIAHENMVAEQWEIRGTHMGPFLNIPATGRPVIISGMSMVEMRAGKFFRDHFYFDSMGVLRQMGLMPSIEATQSLPGRALLWAAVNRVPVAVLTGMSALAFTLTKRIRAR